MDVTAVGLRGGAPLATAKGRSGESRLGTDFLQLLVAHLRYQDPLRPVDDRELTTQLAQFTAVEQLTEQARWSRTVAALGLLGRQVTALVDGRQVTGTVAAVRLVEGRPVLEVGGATVELDQVQRAAAG